MVSGVLVLAYSKTIKVDTPAEPAVQESTEVVPADATSMIVKAIRRV
jgi:hypothetical protein